FRLLAGHAGGAGGLAHVVRLVRGGAGILPQGPPAAPVFHVQTTRCARLSLRARPRPSNARRVPPPGAPAASRAAIHTGARTPILPAARTPPPRCRSRGAAARCAGR